MKGKETKVGKNAAKHDTPDGEAVKTAPEYKTEAMEANVLHSELVKQDEDNLTKARRIGKILEPVRTSLKAGKKGCWLAWVKKNLKFSDKTAVMYINVSITNLPKKVTGLMQAHRHVNKLKPSKRSKRNADASAQAIKWGRRSVSDLPKYIEEACAGHSKVPTVRITATTLPQFRTRLKLFFEENEAKLDNDKRLIIVAEIEPEKEKE